MTVFGALLLCWRESEADQGWLLWRGGVRGAVFVTHATWKAAFQLQKSCTRKCGGGRVVADLYSQTISTHLVNLNGCC